MVDLDSNPTKLVYPLTITGVSRVLFPHKAGGSLIVKDGQVLGSELIAQHTEDPKYFWGRLSATDYPTDAGNSSGSNLAASNPALKSNAEARIKSLRDANPGNTAPIPSDLVTASGSGLDPHITPAAAEYQVARVAKVRGRSQDEIRAMVANATSGRTLGIFGEPRINVLELNLSLDSPREFRQSRSHP